MSRIIGGGQRKWSFVIEGVMGTALSDDELRLMLYTMKQLLSFQIAHAMAHVGGTINAENAAKEITVMPYLGPTQ